MSISLNNIETRVKALESKVSNIPTGGGGIVESKIADPGYIKFANGLIMQWADWTQTFCIPFPNECLIVYSLNRDGERNGNHAWNSDATLSGAPSKTGYSTYAVQTKHLAIGYLITYRLLNIYYAYAYEIVHKVMHLLERFLCLNNGRC